jgi:hypothetical protein
MLGQLRFGRGLDNRKLKATGFVYRYTTRETVEAYAEYLRLQPILRGMREPYRYEREVEEFLRWSPHVRNPNFRKESRLSPDELVELQKLLSTYGDPSAATGASSGARAAQAEAVARAARATGVSDTEDAAGDLTNGAPIEPVKPDPGRTQIEQPAEPSSPVEHYDDLQADEIVSLLDSLEDDDLRALREYERDAHHRARVLAAIDAVLARRAGGPVG